MSPDGSTDGLREIDRWDRGVGWIAHPEEFLQRASHALVADGDVWVIDPVDAPGVDDLLAELGEVAGVVVGIGRHTRDAAAVADRHGVPVYLPRCLARRASAIAAPTELIDGRLPGTDYRVIEVLDAPFWSEVALYGDRSETLVVSEALGTATHFRAGSERLGVHPFLRVMPPRRALGGLSPERVLVGHGAGVSTDAAAALEEALRTARRRIPRVAVDVLGRSLSSVRNG